MNEPAIPTQSYQLRVNARTHEVTEGWIGESLLYVLRERVGLPGAKNACEQGECGSCSVLVDGVLVCSCLVLAASVDGCEIVTVEGSGDPTNLGEPETGGVRLSIVQEAFVQAGAVQCGFCTPGLVMAVEDLLSRDTAPTDLVIREAISGNLCRCTGYGRIIAAVQDAVVRRAGVTP